MNDNDILPAPVIDFSLPAGTKEKYPPNEKWEREYHAFLLMLPELLKTHRGKYVAVHEEKPVDSGDDKTALAMRAYKTYGYVPIYVGLVAERPLPPERVPHFHEFQHRKDTKNMAADHRPSLEEVPSK